MLFIRLAILNLKRNPTRSIVTILATAFGIAGLVFLFGFRDGIFSELENTPTLLYTAHIQIHGKGFRDGYSSEIIIPHLSKIEELLNNRTDVVAYTKRDCAVSIINMHDISHVVLMMGVDPNQEQRVTTLAKHIKQGSFLHTQGSHELVIGDKLAGRLKLKVGDQPALMTRSIYGTAVGVIGKVVGVYRTGSKELDDQVVYVSLADASKLLDLEGQCNEIAVKLKDTALIPQNILFLQQAINDPDCEVLPWYEIMPELKQWEQFYQYSFNVMFAAVVLVIAVMMMNVVLMSVIDRTKELGVMLAIGTSPIQLGCLVLLETLSLELCGGIIGVFLGLCLDIYYGNVGIYFAGMEKAMAVYSLSATTYPIVTPGSLLSGVLAMIGISTITCVYPIIKAVRLQPVKAIYHS